MTTKYDRREREKIKKDVNKKTENTSKDDLVAAFMQDLEDIAVESAEAGKDDFVSEQNIDSAWSTTKETAKDSVKSKVIKKTSGKINEYVDEYADKYRDKGRGQGRTKKNQDINHAVKTVTKHTTENLENLYDDILDDKVDNVESIGQFAKKTALSTGKDIAKRHTKRFADEQAKKVYDKLKTEGDGSRTKNKYIKEGTNLVVKNTADNVVESTFSFLSGDATGEEAINGAVEASANAVKNHVKEKVREKVIAKSSEIVKAGTQKVADKYKDKGRGQWHSKKNQSIDHAANSFTENTTNNLGNLYDDLLDENKSFGESAVNFGKNTAIDTGKDIAKRKATEYTHAQADKVYAKFKTSGTGSRFKNKVLKDTTSTAADAVVSHGIDNVVAVVNGDKDLATAAKDTAQGAIVTTAKIQAKKHGTVVVEKAIVEVTKKVASKMGTQASKQVVISAGGKLAANAAPVIGVAIDAGETLIKYLNGDITGAECIQELGEKGTGAVVASITSMAGGAVGSIFGPVGTVVGAAVGSFIGYIATSCFYGVVNQLLQGHEEARKRHEELHKMRMDLIRMMQERRAEFERVTEELFAERSRIFKASFEQIERAMQSDDIDAFNDALGRLIGSYGKELQFKNFDEFDEFMMDDSTTFKF